MRKNLSAAQRHGWIPREVALQNDARLMPIIREIQATGITSLNGIARALDERGIPTPLNAKGWSGEQGRRMLARSADPRSNCRNGSGYPRAASPALPHDRA